MKRNNIHSSNRQVNGVIKSKSFQMRRSPNRSLPKQRRDRSLDRTRAMIRSYDEMHMTKNNHDYDSSSDNEEARLRTQDPDDRESRYEAWAASIGFEIPNLMWMMDSNSNLTTTSKESFQTPVVRKTRKSQFKPSYLLQKRKEGLTQHQATTSATSSYRSPTSRKHSLLTILVLLTALYFLMGLFSSSASSASNERPTLYYINLKDARPMQVVTKMLSMHAYAYHQTTPSQFAGVCGYPTYQQDVQQQASQLLVEMGLQDLIKFDVCPPIDAILQRDSHYVLLEEPELPSLSASGLSSPSWQATLAAQARPSIGDSAQLWRQVLQGTTQEGTPHRRLRGRSPSDSLEEEQLN